MWVLVEPCSKVFLSFLTDCIGKEHRVTMLDLAKNCLSGAEGEVVVCHGRLPGKFAAERCIYLPMSRRKLPKLSGDVSVVCMDHSSMPPDGKTYYPCGYSGLSCLTISSKTEEQVVISLLRETVSVYGRRIEPFELPVERQGGISDEELLLGYMTRLLLYPPMA